MKAIFVLALAVSFLAESRSLPVGKERRREDVVTRCLVEVLLSKTLTKPDLHPLDQECKDILKTGVPLAAPVEKKSDEEVLTGNEESKDHDPEVPRADVKDIEALLKSVDEKKDTLENDERSQESWDFNNQRDKRIWKPSHRYHHKKLKHKRDEVSEEERENPDEERSQESWSLGDERDKRYRPTYRYSSGKKQKRDEEDDERSQESWSLGNEREKRYRPTYRYSSGKKQKRDEEDDERSQESWSLGNEKEKRYRPTYRYSSGKKQKRDEEDDERSQESWSLGNEKEKRYRPTYRYSSGKNNKRDEEGLEEEREEPDDERSQESWSLGNVKEKRYRPTYRYSSGKNNKRDEEGLEEEREEPDDERSQESWSLGNEREKRYRPTYRYSSGKNQKRDEGDEERSQESWDLNDNGGREKRIWKANLKYHHKKPQKRSGESAEDEGEEPRSDSKEHEEKRHRGDEEEGRERQEALRYLQEKRNEVESRVLGEGDERRSPWVYRGYYHPAWWKKSAEPKTGSQKIEELSKMLMRHQLTSQSELVNERKRSVPLTPEEEKLQNLAGMDMELQKISEKVHENRNE